uniref:Uncharacterized protein n=1 Tax=Candidatus Kentrum sp. LFY TaxID=2126342 RepID=A0A450UD96_9GAMM|nr:MAG: hypothetical protein BECKLFY1418A_GA0070994_101112 [Candidatus Kentron sp. LFY]
MKKEVIDFNDEIIFRFYRLCIYLRSTLSEIPHIKTYKLYICNIGQLGKRNLFFLRIPQKYYFVSHIYRITS